MKIKNLSYAAIAACLGMVGLGSCNKEEAVYQGGEKEMSRLRVMTRAEGESTPPKEAKIYLLDKDGKCTNIVDLEDFNKNGIPATPGDYRIIAIGSNDLSAYKLPEQAEANDSSIIKLNSGKKLTDLLLATEDITLNEGETTQLNMTLNREVICIKDVNADKIPKDVIGTEIIIGPMYKNIRMDGKYTDDTDSIRIALTKDTEDRKWILKGDSIFSLPSKGNPKVILRLITPKNTQEYSYQTTKPLTKNHFVRLDLVYREGLKAYLSASLSAPIWEGTDSIVYGYEKEDLSKEETVKHLAAGDMYNAFFVVSVDTKARTAVLLRKKGDTGVSSKEDMTAMSSKINKPDSAIGEWRLPTIEECKFFLEKCYVNSNNNPYSGLVETGTYYCTKDGKLATVTLSLNDKKAKIITSKENASYSKDYIYRPVIEISY